MWINYLSTTSSPPPPIDTIKPVPLNPKLLWANLLTIEGVADEIQAAQDSADGIVELQAELEKDHTSRVDKNKQSYDGESSGESAVDDEYAIVMQKLRQSKAVKNREAQAKKKTTTVKKLRTKVIDAVTKIRAAAKYMVEKKLPSNLVKFDGRTRQELGQEAFWKKIVSVEDLEYYESRLTIEGILNTVDAEIQSSPEFEWIPTRVLSAQQQKEKLQRETQHAEQFSHFSKFYKTLLCRSKESTEREVVARAAIETLQKRYQKDLTKEGKVNAAKAPKVPIRQKKKTRTQLQEEIISQLQNDNNKLISQLHNQQSTDDVFSTAKETKQKLRMTKRTRVSSSASESESESGSKSSCSTKSSECSTQSTGARSTLSKSKKNSATLPVQINISDDEDTGYFEDTSNETNAKEIDIKIGNKLISLLKSKADEQVNSKRVRTVDKAKESFLQLLNVDVVAEFSFPIYKANLVELPTMFNVTLSNTYTVEQLSKATVRRQFLLELVGAIVSYSSSCSNSSSIPLVADLSLPSILQNIFALKDFVNKIK